MFDLGGSDFQETDSSLPRFYQSFGRSLGKIAFLSIAVFFVSFTHAEPPVESSAPAEPWKGTPSPTNFNFSVLTGAGVIGTSVGWELRGTWGLKILHEGFLPEINDQVFLEPQLGALFSGGASAITYGFALRWNFHQNDVFSYYATGGLGGSFNSNRLGGSTLIYPRVALGAVIVVSLDLAMRFELSHEFIGGGLSIDFDL